MKAVLAGEARTAFLLLSGMSLLSAMLLLGCQAAGPVFQNGAFIHNPYLQLGNRTSVDGACTLMWSAPIASGVDDAVWTVRYGTASGERVATASRVTLFNVSTPYQQYSAELVDIGNRKSVPYRVFQGESEVFSSTAVLPVLGARAFRLVAFGDCGVGSPQQADVARQAIATNPDQVLITGDTVYQNGTASEYETRFWNQYNNSTGAPLMRSHLFTIAPGNHDFNSRNLSTYADGLAYFYFFKFPLNGPDLLPAHTAGASGNGLTNFLNAAGNNYPRMSNYSYNAGNVHFTVIDSNPAVSWTNAQMRAWVAADIQSAPAGYWRVVSYHHPAFHSSVVHRDDKRLRALADLFQENKVDLVLNGHVHNYQRSHPVLYTGKALTSTSLNDNTWNLDTAFDGKKSIVTKGVIHVVTGAGGAGLYDAAMEGKPESLLPFTAKYVGKHSFSLLNFEKDILTFRQIGAGGEELDMFRLRRKK
jgi:acid phosphatase type 7